MFTMLRDVYTHFLKAINRMDTIFPGKKPSITVFPFAMDPIMTARCEMDLSPGTVIIPIRPICFFLTFCKDKCFLLLKPTHMFYNHFSLVKFGRVWGLSHFANLIVEHLPNLPVIRLYQGLLY